MNISSFLKRPSENLAANVQDSERNVARWEETITRLRELQFAVGEELQVIEVQRENYILAALAEQDQAANSELARLRTESDRKMQENSDYAVAIAQAEARLADARSQLSVAKNEEIKEKVRAHLQARLHLAFSVSSESHDVLASTLETQDGNSKLVSTRAHR